MRLFFDQIQSDSSECMIFVMYQILKHWCGIISQDLEIDSKPFSYVNKKKKVYVELNSISHCDSLDLSQ